MYDTIHLMIRENDLDYSICFLEEVSCKIDIDKKKSNEKRIFGYLGNMEIEIWGDVLRIKGSLSKWLSSQNVYGMDFKDVESGIKKLEEKLGISLKNAIVTRIDVAKSFDMEALVESYLERMYFLNGFHRYMFKSNSMYFTKDSKSEVEKGKKRKNNENLQLYFYDKSQEIDDKEDFMGDVVRRHVFILRYELRILKVKYTFKREIHCYDLFSEDFYIELIELWYEMYKMIEKRYESLEDYCELKFNGNKEFYRTCACLCVMAFNMEEEVDKVWKMKKVSPQNKSNVLKLIKELKEEVKSRCKEKSLIDELDEKVESEYQRQKAEVEALKRSKDSLME